MLCGGATAHGQAMPASITGSWKIVKIIPTAKAGCWDNDRAQTLVGSTLRYQKGAMAWKGGAIRVTDAFTRTLTAHHYETEYKVSFAELGLKAAQVTEIDLQHEDADFTGATTEVPGDTVLLAGPGRIVVSACGVYYSAERAPVQKTGRVR